jgi:hypothetical protein
MALVQLRVVMAGLDQDLIRPSRSSATGTGAAGNRVDARVKPAHDDLQLVPIKTQQPIPVPQTALRLRGNDGVGNVDSAPQFLHSLFRRGDGTGYGTL